MKVYDAASIRNVALVGHSGSGKTQLASAALADAGMINRIDRDRASLERSLDSLHDACNRTVIPIQLPIGQEKAFKGVVDLVAKKAFVFQTDESGKFAEAPIPGDMAAAVDTAREALIEMVAEADEKLMEKFFEAGTLSDAELVSGLRS